MIGDRLTVKIHTIGCPERVEPDIEPTVVVCCLVQLVAPCKPRLAQKCDRLALVLDIQRNIGQELVPRLLDVARKGLRLRALSFLHVYATRAGPMISDNPSKSLSRLGVAQHEELKCNRN